MIRIVPVLCVAVVTAVVAPPSFGRGGHSGGMHSASLGGAAGTPLGSPGTNSSGTALSSSGVGSRMKGATFDNDPAVARQDATVDRMVKGSICRGC